MMSQITTRAVSKRIGYLRGRSAEKSLFIKLSALDRGALITIAARQDLATGNGRSEPWSSSCYETRRNLTILMTHGDHASLPGRSGESGRDCPTVTADHW